MRYARAHTGERTIEGQLEDDILETEDGHQYEIGEDARLLAPCEPSAMFCAGRNFAAKIDQMDYDRPDEPDFFIKPPASLHAPGEPIVYPSFTNELTYAGELAAVIGSKCHNVSVKEAENVLRGFTILNDLDALDQPRRTARKAFNGSGPLGPWIETDLDPRGIDMKTEINGKIRQESNTELMLFDPYEIVSFLSERFTFQPGDVVSFGSPENPGLLEPGDEIEIWYEGIGTLSNTVTSQP